MHIYSTVVSYSYIPSSINLHKSLINNTAEEFVLYVLVVDLVPNYTIPYSSSSIKFLSIKDLEVELPERMEYYFDAFEFCNALKPFIIDYLLNNLAYTKLIYFDSDLFICSSLSKVWNLLDQYDFILTPHYTTPNRIDSPIASEIDIVDFGMYNGGFWACRKCQNTNRIITWMKERFPVYGFVDKYKGMFVDQKLLPLIQCYFPESLYILMDKEYNVAFWNIHERPIEYNSNTNSFFLKDKEIVFFHMSGFKFSSPDLVCSYFDKEQNDYIHLKAPWFSEVIKQYLNLSNNDYQEYNKPYEYNFYKGMFLFKELRRLLFIKDIHKADKKVMKLIFIEKLKKRKRKMLKLMSYLE